MTGLQALPPRPAPLFPILVKPGCEFQGQTSSKSARWLVTDVKVARAAIRRGIATLNIDEIAPRIADRFVLVLRSWLSASQWERMRRANAAETDPIVCHSHDFCDANMAMDKAFRDLGFAHTAWWGNDWAANEEAALLWNTAWNEAMPALGGKKRAVV